MKFFTCYILVLLLISCTSSNSEHNSKISGDDNSLDMSPSLIDNDISIEMNNHNTPVKLPATVEPALHLDAQYGNNYATSNLIDGNKNTAWAVPLDGGGIDADVIDWLKFHIKPSRISHIIITNGYAKSKNSYFNNARGRSVLISRVPWEEAEDNDIIFYGILKDTPNPQILQVSEKFDNTNATEDIYIMFESDYYPGVKYNDFCITEVEFFGYQDIDL